MPLGIMAGQEAAADLEDQFDTLVEQGVGYARGATKECRWRNQALLDAFQHPYRATKYPDETDFFKYFDGKARIAGTTYKTWRHSTKAFEFAFRAEMLLFLNLSVSHHIQLHYGAASSLRVYNAHDDQQLLEVLLEFLNQPAEYGIARRMVQVQAKFEQPPPAEGSGRQQVTGRKRRKQADGAAPTAVGAGAGPAAAGQGGAAAESVEMGNDQQSETEEDHSEEQYPDNVVFDDLVAAAEEAYKQEVEQSKSIADELRSVKEQLLIEQVNNTTLRMTLTMLQNDLQREKDNSSTSGTRGCVSCTLLAS